MASKILIVSDTHGYHDTLRSVIQMVSPIDYVIHLGDVIRKEEIVRLVGTCPLSMVAGNNDISVDLPSQEIIMLGKYKVLLVHGHQQRVNFGTDMLKEYARDKNVDIAMFGHTHLPLIEHCHDLTVVNPGSLSLPRQSGYQPSFILMELDRMGEAHFTLNYLKSSKK